ncbi:hypothetical protein B0H12DRAFT_1225112 [Mycena haematopus]|nr:hypothetical protein B0H12DRAFT_1225112 [Mycena haematopus]
MSRPAPTPTSRHAPKARAVSGCQGVWGTSPGLIWMETRARGGEGLTAVVKAAMSCQTPRDCHVAAELKAKRGNNNKTGRIDNPETGVSKKKLIYRREARSGRGGNGKTSDWHPSFYSLDAIIDGPDDCQKVGESGIDVEITEVPLHSFRREQAQDRVRRTRTGSKVDKESCLRRYHRRLGRSSGWCNFQIWTQCDYISAAERLTTTPRETCKVTETGSHITTAAATLSGQPKQPKGPRGFDLCRAASHSNDAEIVACFGGFECH